LNIAAWDNKKIIVKPKVESRNYKKDDGTAAVFSNNQMNGFFPLDDADKGLAKLRAANFPLVGQEGTQADAHAAMVEAGLL